MYCTGCGEQISENTKFCTKCGKANEARTLRVCENCKTPMKDGQETCEKCGKRIVGSNAPIHPLKTAENLKNGGALAAFILGGIFCFHGLWGSFVRAEMDASLVASIVNWQAATEIAVGVILIVFGITLHVVYELIVALIEAVHKTSSEE